MRPILRYCGLGTVLAAATLVAACGGGNAGSFGAGGITPSIVGDRAATGVANALLRIRERRKRRGEAEVLIRIPRKTRPRRFHPDYVSASTQSMTVSVAGIPDQTFNLTPTSKGCFVSGGYTTCLETAFFPTGRQTVAVALYDQTNGSGNVLSQASESLNVAPNAITNISITLDGVPKTAVALVNGSTEDAVPQGKPTSVPVSVAAYDADHNLIMSPGKYSSPVKVMDGDTSGATKLSATSVRKPGGTVSLRYNGSTALSSVTITPSVNGVTQASGTATLTVSSTVTAPTITEYDIPTAGGAPWGIAGGSDGAVWFTEYAYGNVGRVTTLGAMTEYPLPNTIGSPIHPVGITAGPDSALWFTECAGNAIGRITTGGAISEYTLPHPNSAPQEIATGPDGALWFTEYGGAVGRITTTGAITEYPVPTSNAALTGITAGPDGALWFTESQGNKIGRITTLGSVTEYSVPTSNSAPARIAAGPDGTLWFTECATAKIGRITTTGTITEYSVSVPASGASIPYAITAGPDGAMWFTDAGTNAVGRITSFGSVSEYPLAGGPSGASLPLGITSGPNGTLWFSQECSNQIGEMTFTASSSSMHQKPNQHAR